MSTLQGKRILVGVCGSIAAFKAAELVRALRKEEADVTVAMTEAATEFIGPATFAAFTKHPVMLEQFPDDPTTGVAHVDIAESFDLVLIAPATANILGKAAHAVADELIATILSIVECPVIFVPAMNFRMWRNDATVEAVAKLRAAGKRVIDPDVGDLATMAVGEGRFPETEAIVSAVRERFAYAQQLAGKRVVITAGPTREPIDPVRFISNRSSGKMGYALAEAARDMGASVTLISGPTALIHPYNCTFIPAQTAADMLEATKSAVAGADMLIMAAAVADFSPAEPSADKIRRKAGHSSISLNAAPDIIKEVRKIFSGTVVAFSLQAEADLDAAKEKLRDKGTDYIVVNGYDEPGAGFEAETNHVWVVPENGNVVEIPKSAKSIVARKILESILS